MLTKVYVQIKEEDKMLNEGKFYGYLLLIDRDAEEMFLNLINQILETQARKIVYISCNPATQARDLTLLKTKYDIGRIRPVDMFPHTQHVENIVELILK